VDYIKPTGKAMWAIGWLILLHGNCRFCNSLTAEFRN